MASKPTKTEAYRNATDMQRKIADLMLREHGATSVDIQKVTGEAKRRSHYSLSRLADRLGYEYAAYAYEGDLLHHFLLPLKAANSNRKQSAAATKVASARKSASE